MTKKLITLILLLFIFSGSKAQNSFSNLSPKQKIKLAKKEQKAAKKDKEYIQLMDEALILFQDQHFLDAKSKYESASKRRPDNVYPLVMLDDIEIAINAQKEEIKQEEIAETTIPESIILEEEIIISNKIIAIEEDPIAIENKEIIVPLDTEKEIADNIKPDEKKEILIVKPRAQKVYKDDGVYFSEFKEGSAQVSQIEIIKKGVNTSYRMVVHSWGATYYFKGSDPITKDEWLKINEELEKD